MTAHRRMSHKLTRFQRIQHSRDFERLKKEGQRLAQGCMVANWLPRTAGDDSRLGVITSRRIGGAVLRNRARRLLRESFRRHQHQFHTPLDLVLVARPSIVGKRFQEVEVDFLKVLKRGHLLRATS